MANELTPPDPRRLALHFILVDILGSDKVYYQPPATLKMHYPCIVYQRDDAETLYADNVPYKSQKRYTVTHISRDPESITPDEIAKLPLCAFNRFFVADNLNHDVFNVFF